MDDVPVKIGETHNVTVSAVGEKGDGIVRVHGFVLFVPQTKKGEYVKVKITKVLKSVGFAEVVERLEKPERKSKYAQVTEEELAEQEPESQYEDTEDFGEEE